MRNTSWGAPTDWETVCRRHAGRRQYHSWRRVQQAIRRVRVRALLCLYGLGVGVQARIAGELGCHRSTVCRDVAALLAWRPVAMTTWRDA